MTKNKPAREATKQSMIQQLILSHISLANELGANKSIHTTASEHAYQRLPAEYLPFSSLRAVFHAPISSPDIDKSHSGSNKLVVECELIQYSDSTDVAVLRVVHPSSPTSIKLCPLTAILPQSSLHWCLEVLLVEYRHPYRSGLPALLESKVLLMPYSEKRKSLVQKVTSMMSYEDQDVFLGVLLFTGMQRTTFTFW